MRIIGECTLVDIDKVISEQVQENIEATDELMSDLASYCANEARATSKFADRSGSLRRSIRMKKSKFVGGGYIVSATGKNISGAHAHLVEYGHVKWLWGKQTGERVAPKPFMRTALAKTIIYARQQIRKANQ